MKGFGEAVLAALRMTRFLTHQHFSDDPPPKGRTRAPPEERFPALKWGVKAAFHANITPALSVHARGGAA